MLSRINSLYAFVFTVG